MKIINLWLNSESEGSGAIYPLMDELLCEGEYQTSIIPCDTNCLDFNGLQIYTLDKIQNTLVDEIRGIYKKLKRTYPFEYFREFLKLVVPRNVQDSERLYESASRVWSQIFSGLEKESKQNCWRTGRGLFKKFLLEEGVVLCGGNAGSEGDEFSLDYVGKKRGVFFKDSFKSLSGKEPIEEIRFTRRCNKLFYKERIDFENLFPRISRVFDHAHKSRPYSERLENKFEGLYG